MIVSMNPGLKKTMVICRQCVLAAEIQCNRIVQEHNKEYRRWVITLEYEVNKEGEGRRELE